MPRADADGRGAVGRPHSLDRIDRAIVEALQENGREPFRAIARRIGVPESTVRARYAALCRDDVLQVVGVTNPLGLGFEAEALVAIVSHGPPDALADEIAGWDEASYVVVTAGRFDILAEFVCSDRKRLLELTSRVRALPDVASAETFVYLQLVKQIYRWGAANGPRRLEQTA